MILSQQLDAIFVLLKLLSRTCKPGAIFSAICCLDIAGVSNMFETLCNFSATKIVSSCHDKNRLCKQALTGSELRLLHVTLNVAVLFNCLCSYQPCFIM